MQCASARRTRCGHGARGRRAGQRPAAARRRRRRNAAAGTATAAAVSRCRPLRATVSATALCPHAQVYTAEEKAALAMFNFEENKRKEAKILEDMRRLVQSTLGSDDAEAGPAPPPA